MKNIFIMLFVSTFFLLSCGNKSEVEKWNKEEQRAEMYSCPMCGGTGILEYMPGDIMAPRIVCKGCQGNKVVTKEQYDNIVKIIQSCNPYYPQNNPSYPNGGGRSAYEIELQLKKAYDLLYSLQDQYENCTSGVLRTQYPSMIREQQELINRLEYELMNAQ